MGTRVKDDRDRLVDVRLDDLARQKLIQERQKQIEAERAARRKKDENAIDPQPATV